MLKIVFNFYNLSPFIILYTTRNKKQIDTRFNIKNKYENTLSL